MLATSLSLIVIFLPIAFMGGIVGRFFSSFGLTVAFAVAMSLFVSFTLTPMLCSRFLKLEPAEAGHAKSEVGLLLPDRSTAATAGSSAVRCGSSSLVVLLTILVDRQHRADRQDHGPVADPARRPERVRGHASPRPKATRLERTDRADRPSSRTGSGSSGAPSTSSRRSARPTAAGRSRARATSRGRRSTCG